MPSVTMERERAVQCRTAEKKAELTEASKATPRPARSSAIEGFLPPHLELEPGVVFNGGTSRALALSTEPVKTTAWTSRLLSMGQPTIAQELPARARPACSPGVAVAGADAIFQVVMAMRTFHGRSIPTAPTSSWMISMPQITFRIAPAIRFTFHSATDPDQPDRIAEYQQGTTN